MSIITIPFVLSCMLWLTTALPPNTISMRSVTSSTLPLPPSQDPFYTAPAGYENAAPGAILRVRPSGLAKLTPYCSAAYNILYRTTDSNYKSTWAVTTLFIPEINSTTNSTSGSTLLSYQPACKYISCSPILIAKSM